MLAYLCTNQNYFVTQHSINPNHRIQNAIDLVWYCTFKVSKTFSDSFVTSPKNAARHSALPVHATALWSLAGAAVATQSPQYRISLQYLIYLMMPLVHWPGSHELWDSPMQLIHLLSRVFVLWASDSAAVATQSHQYWVFPMLLNADAFQPAFARYLPSWQLNCTGESPSKKFDQISVCSCSACGNKH